MNAKLNPNLLNARRSGDYIYPNGKIMKNTGRAGRRNCNTLVVGSAGTGKTYGMTIEEILSGAGGASMVVADTKGMLYESCAAELEKMGFKVLQLDFIAPEKSMHYNSIAYLKVTNDVQKVSNMIVFLNLIRENVKDPFWPQSEQMLLNACIGYLMEDGKGFDKSFYGLNRLLSTFDADALCSRKPCDATRIFEHHKELYKKRTGRESWACEQFDKFVGFSEHTFSTVLVSAYSDLSSLDTHEMRQMTASNDFDINSLANEKTALFINVSDTDRSKDTAINIFYTQVMDTLCRYADSLPDKHLPVPVRFILDDFGTGSRIDGFESMISNIRSRGISVMLMLQSLAQLEQGYGIGAKTIMANCAVKVYMGGSDPDTASYFSALTNKPLEKLLNMPYMTHWLIRQGEQPRFGRTVLLDEYALDESQLSDTAEPAV